MVLGRFWVVLGLLQGYAVILCWFWEALGAFRGSYVGILGGSGLI